VNDVSKEKECTNSNSEMVHIVNDNEEGIQMDGGTK